jgi:hypothetical protein
MDGYSLQRDESFIRPDIGQIFFETILQNCVGLNRLPKAKLSKALRPKAPQKTTKAAEGISGRPPFFP